MELHHLTGRKPQLSEMGRIMQLPRSAFTPDTVLDEVVEYWTQRTRTPYGDWRLRPVQALALQEAYENQGLVGAIGVGFGKTLITLLLHHAFPHIDPARVMLFLPASMKKSLAKAAHQLYPLFKINTQLTIASYAEIQDTDRGPELFRKHSPELVIFDEAHYLKTATSTRTGRVLMYADEAPDAKFAVLSGTLFGHSIKNAAHLCDLVLRENSPLPRIYSPLEDMAACVDLETGASFAEKWQWQRFAPVVSQFYDGRLPAPFMKLPTKTRKDVARTSLRNLISSTAGVVQTSKQYLGTALNFLPLELEPPKLMSDILRDVEETYQLPTGEEIDSPMQLVAALRQISMGFYYRPVWPGGKVDKPWVYAVSRLAKAIRKTISRYRTRGYDSRALVLRALAAGKLDKETELVDAWRQWEPQMHKPPPPREAVWFTDWALEQAVSWASCGNEPGIVWYSHSAVMERLDELKMLPVIRPGQDPPPDVQPHPIACSIRSHGVGQNLQGANGKGGWGRGIIMSSPASGIPLEQLLGRMHREGQWRDSVTWAFMLHTATNIHALQNAKASARVEEGLSAPQRILFGTWLEKSSCIPS